MRLTTIGSGTAAPSPTRVQSGHVLEAGSARVLLDCGSGVVFRMAELGIRWQLLTHLVISHFHADHTSDVATLLYAWRYGDLPPRTAPVEIIGPHGTAELLNRLAAAFGSSLLTLGYPVTVRELEGGEAVELEAGLRLSARKVPHTDESVAYSVEHGGRRVVYSGDSGFDPTLGEWAAGCDVFLCECSLPETMAIATHLTPEQCGALAAIARPELMALTHFYPPVERVDAVGAVSAHWDGRTALTHDGWMLELEDR